MADSKIKLLVVVFVGSISVLVQLAIEGFTDGWRNEGIILVNLIAFLIGFKYSKINAFAVSGLITLGIFIGSLLYFSIYNHGFKTNTLGPLITFLYVYMSVVVCLLAAILLTVCRFIVSRLKNAPNKSLKGAP